VNTDKLFDKYGMSVYYALIPAIAFMTMLAIFYGYTLTDYIVSIFLVLSITAVVLLVVNVTMMLWDTGKLFNRIVAIVIGGPILILTVLLLREIRNKLYNRR
jgi:peptidoglycan/LPS O-acetylase OafA/YrhL